MRLINSVFVAFSHLGGVNDAEAVGLRKLMQLQFCPDGDIIFRNTQSHRSSGLMVNLNKSNTVTDISYDNTNPAHSINMSL